MYGRRISIIHGMSTFTPMQAHFSIPSVLVEGIMYLDLDICLFHVSFFKLNYFDIVHVYDQVMLYMIS